MVKIKLEDVPKNPINYLILSIPQYPEYKEGISFPLIAKQQQNFLRYRLKQQLIGKEVEIDKLTTLFHELRLQYYSSVITPGREVGLDATQGIGEATTQATLNTFHLAGAKTGVTGGIKAYKELIGSGNRSQPTIIVHFINPDMDIFDIIALKNQIVHVTIGNLVLNDYAMNINNDNVFATSVAFPNGFPYWYNLYHMFNPKIAEFLTLKPDEKGGYHNKWFLRLYIDVDKMYELGLTMQMICDTINDTKRMCIPSPLNIGIIDIYVRQDDNDNDSTLTTLATIIRPALSFITVSGIEGITDLTPAHIKIVETISKETVERVESVTRGTGIPLSDFVPKSETTAAQTTNSGAASSSDNSQITIGTKGTAITAIGTRKINKLARLIELKKKKLANKANAKLKLEEKQRKEQFNDTTKWQSTQTWKINVNGMKYYNTNMKIDKLVTLLRMVGYEVDEPEEKNMYPGIDALKSYTLRVSMIIKENDPLQELKRDIDEYLDSGTLSVENHDYLRQILETATIDMTRYGWHLQLNRPTVMVLTKQVKNTTSADNFEEAESFESFESKEEEVMVLAEQPINIKKLVDIFKDLNYELKHKTIGLCISFVNTPRKIIANKLADETDAETHAKAEGRVFDTALKRASRYYYAFTTGDNIYGLLTHPEIDPYHTYSNNINNNIPIFGIEMSRTFFIKEFFNILEASGQSLNLSHILLVADYTTRYGYVSKITSVESVHKNTSTLSKLPLRDSIKSILNAAMFGARDVNYWKEVTPALLTGMKPQIGPVVSDTYCPIFNVAYKKLKDANLTNVALRTSRTSSDNNIKRIINENDGLPNDEDDDDQNEIPDIPNADRYPGYIPSAAISFPTVPITTIAPIIDIFAKLRVRPTVISSYLPSMPTSAPCDITKPDYTVEPEFQFERNNVIGDIIIPIIIRAGTMPFILDNLIKDQLVNMVNESPNKSRANTRVEFGFLEAIRLGNLYEVVEMIRLGANSVAIINEGIKRGNEYTKTRGPLRDDINQVVKFLITLTK